MLLLKIWTVLKFGLMWVHLEVLLVIRDLQDFKVLQVMVLKVLWEFKDIQDFKVLQVMVHRVLWEFKDTLDFKDLRVMGYKEIKEFKDIKVSKAIEDIKGFRVETVLGLLLVFKVILVIWDYKGTKELKEHRVLQVLDIKGTRV